jgi:hypothetical protein
MLLQVAILQLQHPCNKTAAELSALGVRSLCLSLHAFGP